MTTRCATQNAHTHNERERDKEREREREGGKETVNESESLLKTATPPNPQP